MTPFDVTRTQMTSYYSDDVIPHTTAYKRYKLAPKLIYNVNTKSYLTY